MSRTFNGTTSDYLENVTTYLTPKNATYTYSAWIYPTALPTGDSASIISEPLGNGFGLYLSKSDTGGGFTLNGFTALNKGAGSHAASTDSAIVLNQWQYVTYIFNSATKVSHLFLNGVEVTYSTQSSAGNLVGTAYGVMVGNNALAGGRDCFTGDIDSAAIWKFALTTGQITAAMAYQGSAAVTPLTSYWPLLGTTSPEPDLSGNNHPLTVAGTTQGPNSPGQTPPSPPPPAGQNIFATNEASIDAFRTPFMGTLNVLGALIR